MMGSVANDSATLDNSNPDTTNTNTSPYDFIIAAVKNDPSFATLKDNDGSSIIQTCLASGIKRLDVLQLLLTAYPGAASLVNDEGFMTLHTSCFYCPRDHSVIELILQTNPGACMVPVEPKNGISQRRSRNFCGSYPIHIALANNPSFEVVSTLINECPEVLRKGDKNGSTPLGVALKHNASDAILNLFLAVDGGTARIIDNCLNTPLHIACMHGCSADVMETLILEWPMAVCLSNRDGLTPLELAQWSGHCSDEVVDMLQEAAYEEIDREVLEVDIL